MIHVLHFKYVHSSSALAALCDRRPVGSAAAVVAIMTICIIYDVMMVRTAAQVMMSHPLPIMTWHISCHHHNVVQLQCPLLLRPSLIKE